MDICGDFSSSGIRVVSGSKKITQIPNGNPGIRGSPTGNHVSTSSLNFYRSDALPDDKNAASKAMVGNGSIDENKKTNFAFVYIRLFNFFLLSNFLKLLIISVFLLWRLQHKINIQLHMGVSLLPRR